MRTSLNCAGPIFFTKTPSQDTGSQNKAEECKESSHDSIAKGHRHSDLIRSDDHCVTLWAECWRFSAKSFRDSRNKRWRDPIKQKASGIIWLYLDLFSPNFTPTWKQKNFDTAWFQHVSAASYSHRIRSRGTWTSTSMARVANSKLLIVSDALEIEGLMHTSLSGIPFCWGAPPSVGSFSWAIVACCGTTGLIWHNTIDNTT